MTGFQLAPMRWWHIPQVQQLESELFTDDPWSVAQFWSELARVPDTRHYSVAVAGDGAILGYAGAFVAGDEADVQTIAVAPPAQGRGVARALLGELVSNAGARGARRIGLEVRADNEAAIGLYRSTGFAAVGRRRDYYGRGRDALLMSRPLPGAPAPGAEQHANPEDVHGC